MKFSQYVDDELSWASVTRSLVWRPTGTASDGKGGRPARRHVAPPIASHTWSRSHSRHESLLRRPELARIRVHATTALGKQPPKPPHLVLIRPEDPVALHGRPAAMDPAADDPIPQLQVAHLQLGGQVGQPPLVPPEQLAVRPLVADQAAALEQLVNDRRGERPATLGRVESLGVQRLGDLRRGVPARRDSTTRSMSRSKSRS